MAANYNRLADRFDERYKHETFPGIQAQLRQLIDRPGMDVLEVGCGTGHWLTALSNLPAGLLGVDPSPAMLDKARSQAAGAALVCASAENLPFWYNSVAEHLSNPERREDALKRHPLGRLGTTGEH